MAISESLRASANCLPLRLVDWTSEQHHSVAILRQRAGLPLYRGMASPCGLETHPAWIPNAEALSLAVTLRVVPAFEGVAFLNVTVTPDELSAWLERLPLGTILSDPGFLSLSRSAQLVVRPRSIGVLRLLGDSAGDISLVSRHHRDREVVFPPGERFRVVRVHRRYLGGKVGRVWMVDAEQTELRSASPPRWPEYDDPRRPRQISEEDG